MSIFYEKIATIKITSETMAEDISPNVVIFVDSIGFIYAIDIHWRLGDVHLVEQCKNQTYIIIHEGMEVVLQWIPSYCGIP